MLDNNRLTGRDFVNCLVSLSALAVSYLLLLCILLMNFKRQASVTVNSFSYLVIPPPCLTMPRWSFCPPTYLFCCLLPYLFHCIPFTFYIVGFKYIIFSILLPTEQIHWALSRLPYFQPWYVCSLFFLGAQLMTTSTTSNRCCDTHTSPAMTFFIHRRSHLRNSK